MMVLAVGDFMAVLDSGVIDLKLSRPEDLVESVILELTGDRHHDRRLGGNIAGLECLF